MIILQRRSSLQYFSLCFLWACLLRFIPHALQPRSNCLSTDTDLRSAGVRTVHPRCATWLRKKWETEMVPCTTGKNKCCDDGEQSAGTFLNSKIALFLDNAGFRRFSSAMRIGAFWATCKAPSCSLKECS